MYFLPHIINAVAPLFRAAVLPPFLILPNCGYGSAYLSPVIRLTRRNPCPSIRPSIIIPQNPRRVGSFARQGARHSRSGERVFSPREFLPPGAIEFARRARCWGGYHQSIARSRNYLAIDAGATPEVRFPLSHRRVPRQRRRGVVVVGVGWRLPIYLPTGVVWFRHILSLVHALYRVTPNRRRRLTSLRSRSAARLRTFVPIFADPSIPRATLEV